MDRCSSSTDTSCVRCDDVNFPLSFVFLQRTKIIGVSQCCHGVLPHILEMYQVQNSNWFSFEQSTPLQDELFQLFHACTRLSG